MVYILKVKVLTNGVPYPGEIHRWTVIDYN